MPWPSRGFPAATRGDTLFGSDGADFIQALSGRDFIDGGGDDVVNGEFDADVVLAGPGDDFVGAGFDPDDPGDDVAVRRRRERHGGLCRAW